MATCFLLQYFLKNYFNIHHNFWSHYRSCQISDVSHSCTMHSGHHILLKMWSYVKWTSSHLNAAPNWILRRIQCRPIFWMRIMDYILIKFTGSAELETIENNLANQISVLKLYLARMEGHNKIDNSVTMHVIFIH